MLAAPHAASSPRPSASDWDPFADSPHLRLASAAAAASDDADCSDSSERRMALWRQTVAALGATDAGADETAPLRAKRPASESGAARRARAARGLACLPGAMATAAGIVAVVESAPWWIPVACFGGAGAMTGAAVAWLRRADRVDPKSPDATPFP